MACECSATCCVTTYLRACKLAFRRFAMVLLCLRWGHALMRQIMPDTHAIAPAVESQYSIGRSKAVFFCAVFFFRNPTTTYLLYVDFVDPQSFIQAIAALRAYLYIFPMSSVEQPHLFPNPPPRTRASKPLDPRGFYKNKQGGRKTKYSPPSLLQRQQTTAV